MCDFSIDAAKSRPAKQGDELKTHDFGSSRGFCGAKDPRAHYEATAVCLLPGTEVAFRGEVLVRSTDRFTVIVNGALRAFGLAPKGARTATFIKVDKNIVPIHHDALQFSDGTIVLLNDLVPNQKATVLSLPATPRISDDDEKKSARQLAAA